MKAWGSAVGATGGSSPTPITAVGNPQGIPGSRWPEPQSRGHHHRQGVELGDEYQRSTSATGPLRIDEPPTRSAPTTTPGRLGCPLSASRETRISKSRMSVSPRLRQVQSSITPLTCQIPPENDPAVPANGVVVVDRTLTAEGCRMEIGLGSEQRHGGDDTLPVAQPAFAPAAGYRHWVRPP